jgi:hypothetical protein
MESETGSLSSFPPSSASAVNPQQSGQLSSADPRREDREGPLLERARPASPNYGFGAATSSDARDSVSSGNVFGVAVPSIYQALRVMYECYKAANISVADTTIDAEPSPWRTFARPFERLLVNPDDDEAVDRIVKRIHRDGQNDIRGHQFLQSLQLQAAGRGSSGQGRRTAGRAVSPALSVASSSGSRRQREPPEDAEERENKRAATALRAEVAANMVELDRDAARASADQRGVGDFLLRHEWSIDVKVLKPEIEAAVLATKACTAAINAVVRELFVCNNISPELLPPSKFANLALVLNPDDSPAPSDLLLRDRLGAVITAVRHLHPLAVRAQTQSRRLMDGYNLMYHTQGANAWTLRQLQSREVADEQKKEFDLNHKVLRTWEEKVRSALIHVEQQTAFLSRDGALRGPVDPLVQAHLTQMAASRNRQHPADGRRVGRTGNGGGGGAGKTRRPPRGPKPPPAAKPASKDKRKRPGGAGAKASADAADGGND